MEKFGSPPQPFEKYTFVRERKETDTDEDCQQSMLSFLKLHQQFSMIIDDPVPKSFIIAEPEDMTIEYKILFDMLHDLNQNIARLTRSFYQEQMALTNEVGAWMQNVFKSGGFCTIDISSYNQQTELDFYEIPEIASLSTRCSKIVKKLKSIPLETVKTVDQCREALRNNKNICDALLEYAPASDFDTVLRDFMDYNGMIKMFGVLAENPVDSLQTINMREISHIYKSFLWLIQPGSKEELYHVKSTLMRVSFDSIYLEHYKVYEPVSIDILKKCSVIAKKSPKELDTQTKLIPEEYYDQPFEKFVNETKEIKEISDLICSTQFQICPTEIASIMYDALKKIENYEGKERSINDMCFDDFFEMFLPIFACNPPCDFISLAGLLKNNTYKYSNAIDFARLVFVSTVDYIVENK